MSTSPSTPSSPPRKRLAGLSIDPVEQNTSVQLALDFLLFLVVVVAVWFQSRSQVLTEQMLEGPTGIGGTGESDPLAREAAERQVAQ